MSPVADAPPPRWHPPVAPVEVVRPFHQVAPFAPGGHRGLDLRSSPGQRVGAPCRGRVTFRGTVAGGPSTVTIDCGRLRATVQRVTPLVITGQQVGRGAPIGRATQAAIDLSARRPDGAYVDPAGLLRVHDRPAPPIGAIRPAGRPSRPPLPAHGPARPVRLADRALVNLQAGVARHDRLSTPQARVDLPLGVAGVVLMLVVAGAWVARAGRRPGAQAMVARRAGTARFQR